MIILQYYTLIIWKGVHMVMWISKILTQFTKQYEKSYLVISPSISSKNLYYGEALANTSFPKFLFPLENQICTVNILLFEMEFLFYLFLKKCLPNNHNVSVSHFFKKNDSPLEKEEVASFTYNSSNYTVLFHKVNAFPWLCRRNASLSHYILKRCLLDIQELVKTND